MKNGTYLLVADKLVAQDFEKGYAVAITLELENVKEFKDFDSAIKKLRKWNGIYVKNPIQVYLGVWNGVYHLVIVIEDKFKALKIGQENKQDYIYDFKNEVEIKC